MVLLIRISFFRLPVTCCQDEEISPVVFLPTCFSSRCASRGLIKYKTHFALPVVDLYKLAHLHYSILLQDQ